ncbi:MAG TPA: hypothetical protein VJ623_02210 [Holophagaceae bacterium]|nr:hypothetical protein [Holophagaceae bacterium]
MRRLAPLGLLLLLGACKFKRQEAPAIYAPFEEGLTLGYEDPSLTTPEEQRATRFQVRVSQGLLDPDKPGLLKLTQSSLTTAPFTYMVRVDDGSLELLKEDGTTNAWVFPKGFPDRVAQWRDEARQLEYRVIGPAAWDNPAGVKGVHDPVGIWVEADGPGGKRRSLFLRGLGEVEGQVLRGHDWVTVRRLVDRAFTDDHLATK